MKYLWTEDSGAGLHFWNLANEYLFDNKLKVESKNSNQGILDAVRKLVPESGDIYYIAFDQVYDNMDVVNKFIELQHLAAKYPKQIILLDMICFEYIILSFYKLIKWTGRGNQTSIRFREEILNALQDHRININQIKDQSTLNYLMGFKKFSTERVIKSLTNNLTDTDDWSVRGNLMGDCWHKNCCALANSDKKRCHVDKNMGRDKIMEILEDKEMQHIIEKIDFSRIS